MAIESPNYRVISKQTDYEVRQYEPYIVAQVDIESEFDEAINNGFNILAGYIFGDNKARTHIAMTAPVTEEKSNAAQRIPMTRPVTATSSGNKRYTISFTMPQKYTYDTLPEPNNNSIRLKAVPAHKMAAIRFRGQLNARIFEQKEGELKKAVVRDGFKTKSNVIAAQYDPPFIPGFLRRNEVLVEI
jgi:hypothetical protein